MQNPFTRLPVWSWFFVFFGVIFAVDGVMVYFAETTFNGVTDDQAYQHGLAYNQTLAQRETEQKLGWHVTSDMLSAEPQKGVLKIQLADNRGEPLVPTSLVLTLVRPVEQVADVSLTIPPRTDGIYTVAVDVPLKGQWDSILTITRGDDALYSHKRLYFK
ncbi:MAG: hypothetical protein GC134_08165 [Proteobacteria bacterium]|nr:hypothetical protein [Pseudomonadota bacterium]